MTQKRSDPIRWGIQFLQSHSWALHIRARSQLMVNHSITRVPIDDSYALLIGKAVYLFAYYEWIVINIVEHLVGGFLRAYCREKLLKSGDVQREFQSAINTREDSLTNLLQTNLQSCCDEFKKLIVKRNALIHAHPITEANGSQILAYQTRTTKPLSEITWSNAEVELIIQEFDSAACQAAEVLDQLHQKKEIPA